MPIAFSTRVPYPNGYLSPRGVAAVKFTVQPNLSTTFQYAVPAGDTAMTTAQRLDLLRRSVRTFAMWFVEHIDPPPSITAMTTTWLSTQQATATLTGMWEITSVLTADNNVRVRFDTANFPANAKPQQRVALARASRIALDTLAISSMRAA